MLVQRRPDELRLVTQHDHALFAGHLAAAWRAEGPLPFSVILATGVHDAGWRALDVVPAVEEGTEGPVPFDRFPPEEKLAAAAAWLDHLETLDPYAAALVSRHYSTFGSGEEGPFHRREETRLRVLRRARPECFPEREAEDRHLAVLRLLDNLSLLVCLTPPGAEREGVPGWLSEDLLRLPDGSPLRMEWIDEATAALDPSPFGDAGVEARIPYRSLPRERPAVGWADAWARATRRTMPVRLTGR